MFKGKRDSRKDAEAKKHYEEFLHVHDNGELDLAREHIAKANELSPGYAGSFGYLGQSYENRGELRKAIEAYRQFVRYGSMPCNEGCFDSVLEAKSKHICELEKKLADRETRGALSTEQQKSLFINPTNLNLFASGLRSMTGIEKETGVLRSVEISPKVAKWAIPFAERIREAEGLCKERKIVDALTRFRELEDQIPGAAMLLMDIGVCYAETGNTRSAESWFRKAWQTAPDEFRDRVKANMDRLGCSAEPSPARKG